MQRLAPAKINLFLHVGAPGADGYHPICSLMAFADLGDRLRLTPAAAMTFEVEGPLSHALSDTPDNLVTRARDRLLAEISGPPPPPFRLTLDKQLPIAAGLGGGSVDAAATLKLVAAFVGGLAPERLAAIAAELGADVTACLASRAVIAEGRGERLSAAPKLPPLNVVLANPGAPVSTRAVYEAFDRRLGRAGAERPALPPALRSAAETAALLTGTRNDLEAPALALQPLIGAALTVLRGAPETLLARISGSGATVFALCADEDAARRLCGRIAAAHPTWWVRACRLG